MMRLCWVCVLMLVFLVHGVVQLDMRFNSCKTPTLKNGRIRSRQRGRALKFLCNTGYQLAGDRMVFCRNGAWDFPIPKCVHGTCAKKDAPLLNGIILPSHNGGVLNFYCKQGYELNGAAAVFCDGDQWDGARPSCLPSQTKPNLMCDFEDPDICHWTHDLNHDMDWVRDSYNTPTGYSMPTGPSYDHTKGKGSNGHYMYIESSSRRINDTARLISPIFEVDGNVCLEFWYHMYGNTTGTLRAYIKRFKDPWPLNPNSAVFSKSGNQGNVWYREFVELGQVPDQFQIVMEGVRGNGYVSDIAIDDVQLIPNCVYEDHIQSTTEFVTLTSEPLKTMESCENRCGLKASGNESSQVTPCDCDESCFENSRCCPDYIDFCLASLPTLEWSTTSEAYTDITGEPPSSATAVKNNTTTNRPIARSTKATTTTKKPTTVSVTKSSPRTTKLAKALPLRSTTTRQPTVQPKKPAEVPQRIIPTLHFLQPPTTPKVVEIIIPKLPPNKNSSKITFVKPKTTAITTDRAYHDDIEMPSFKPSDNNDDEPLLLTSPLPLDEESNDINDVSVQDKEDYVEKIGSEKDYPFKISDVDRDDNVGEIKTEFKQVQEEQSSLMLVAIGTVCGIAILGVVAGVVLVKFRFVRFRNRRMASGRGDSQSDVRFLTADEVLDFSLDKHYDDL